MAAELALLDTAAVPKGVTICNVRRAKPLRTLIGCSRTSLPQKTPTSLPETIYPGLDYGFQFWLGASSVSGRRIDWVESQGQGGQRIFVVPTLDLVAVVTAGTYYGNDRLANLVPKVVFDDYVLPSVDAAR